MKNILLNPKISIVPYCVLAFLMACIPSIVLFKAAYFGFRYFGLDPSRFSPPEHALSFWGIIGSIVMAPVAETFCLALLLIILSSFIKSRLNVAIISGLLWGITHGLFGLLWFFAPAWGFFILSCAYLGWLDRGFKFAFIAALLPHMMQNSLSIILTIYLG